MVLRSFKIVVALKDCDFLHPLGLKPLRVYKAVLKHNFITFFFIVETCMC